MLISTLTMAFGCSDDSTEPDMTVADLSINPTDKGGDGPAVTPDKDVTKKDQGKPAPNLGNAALLWHSCGEDWMTGGLAALLKAKNYIKALREINYLSAIKPDTGRPNVLEPTPGDATDVRDLIFWFNDYMNNVKTYGATTNVNRILIFKSGYETTNIASDGPSPGDPFSTTMALSNYKAVFTHPQGSGKTYTYKGKTYKALDDVFAKHPDVLFVYVTSPPRHYAPTQGATNAEAKRARTFYNWIKSSWLPKYNAAHPKLKNVAVFDWFNLLAYPDNHATHPNRQKKEYAGESGDSHPNAAAHAESSKQFVIGTNSFLDKAYNAWSKPAPTAKLPGTPPVVKATAAKWITIQAGTYTMGSPTSEPCRSSTMETQHKVTLTHKFKLTATEVTQGQFKDLMGYNPSHFAFCGSDCPVEYITWNEAAAYANALSKKQGLATCYSCSLMSPGDKTLAFCDFSKIYPKEKIYTCPGYRLPTDAEWEYAYRAGTKTAYYNGANSAAGCWDTDTTLDKIAWYQGNAKQTLHLVGKKTANKWGLHDMSGNVWEFVHDGIKVNLGAAAVTDPYGDESQWYKVLRGTSAFGPPNQARAAARYSMSNMNRCNTCGFRVAQTVK